MISFSVEYDIFVYVIFVFFELKKRRGGKVGQVYTLPVYRCKIYDSHLYYIFLLFNTRSPIQTWPHKLTGKGVGSTLIILDGFNELFHGCQIVDVWNYIIRFLQFIFSGPPANAVGYPYKLKSVDGIYLGRYV